MWVNNSVLNTFSKAGAYARPTWRGLCSIQAFGQNGNMVAPVSHYEGALRGRPPYRKRRLVRQRRSSELKARGAFGRPTKFVRSLDVRKQRSDRGQKHRTSSLGDICEWGGTGVGRSKAGLDGVGCRGRANGENRRPQASLENWIY